MKKILLACSAGMSTSIVVNKMQKYAAEKKWEVEIVALPASDAMDRLNEGWNVVLLGPQVRFLENQFQTAAKKHGLDLPVGFIPFQVYAIADAEKIFNLIDSLIEEFNK